MTADVPGDFSNSIQNHFLSFSLNYFPLCFVLFYCSTSVLIVFFLCRRRLVQMRNGMNLLLSLSLFLHSLSFTVPFPVLRFAHLQPPVTMSKVFSPFPEPSEEWTEVKILGLSQTHTTQSLKERNNFFCYYRWDNWHFWEKHQVFSYSLTAWRKLWPEYTVYFICPRTLTFHSTVLQSF